MMRIRQTPFRANRKISQDEDDGGEEDGKYLQSNVDSEGEARVAMIESSREDGGGDDTEESYRCKNAVGGDERMILGQAAESVAHACIVVLVSLESEAAKMGGADHCIAWWQNCNPRHWG